MKTMKLIMGSMCLAVFCASAAWVEYKIVSSLGSGLSLFALTSMSAAILVALRRAPKGYENADGFHARARKRRSDTVRHGQRTHTAKMDMVRFLVARPSRAHK
jgi:hypothetical protein